jgi:hypothetical protein
MESGTYRIVLLCDHREQMANRDVVSALTERGGLQANVHLVCRKLSGGHLSTHRALMFCLFYLIGTQMTVDYRTGVVLPLGDYVWVAEHCTDRAREKLVVDIVVERKREDDLAHSIMDKSNRCVCCVLVDPTCRYADQKTRLIESGIRQRVLLVEKVNTLTTRVPADPRVLRQACTGSQVCRGMQL